MSKSIASKTLAIAEKREAERLEAVKEKFLDIMRKDFERRVIICEPWTAVGTTFYTYAETFYCFELKDLEVVCKDVGFNLKYEYRVGHSLSIPEWVKGQKRTQAQLMLYWSNIEINRKIKSRKEQARRMCKEALEKIKNGDFKSSKFHGGCEIQVIVSYSEYNREFNDEVTRIFAKRNFQLISIDAKSKTWIFSIKEK